MALTTACVAAAGYFGWLVLAAAWGALDPRRDLPLEFCTITGLMAPAAIVCRNRAVFDFFYYGAASGVLGACITPIFAPHMPHPRAISFWALHGGVVVTAVFAVAVLRKRPSYRGIFTTIAWLTVILIVVVPANLWFDANYMYLHQQPAGSILAMLAPGAWFVPSLILLGLLLFHLAYLPFAIELSRPTLKP